MNRLLIALGTVFNRRRPTLAVAQTNAFVPSSWGHHHRAAGIQVHVPDYDHADCDPGSVGDRLVDAALVHCAGKIGGDKHADNLAPLT